jgi:hypothetical protein
LNGLISATRGILPAPYGPFVLSQVSSFSLFTLKNPSKMEPLVGFEPTTCSLRRTGGIAIHQGLRALS